METNITFTKQNGHYVGLVTLTCESSIHIEREDDGLFAIMQSHKQNANYANVDDINPNNKSAILDFTIVDEVYPVYIKLISAVGVTSACVITA